MACAVPVPPTGGPPDTTPPTLLTTIPENGQVQFSGMELEFLFDEAIDMRSFTRAFSITPDVNGLPEISGSAKKVKVRLPEEPRPETTYIVTLEASLRDSRSVALTAPITLAFSTGSTIDAGKLSGKVVRSTDGSVGQNVDIFAYADGDSTTLSGPPLYRTQTGNDGTFRFTHLAEKDYFVVALRDGNRNRLLNPGEPFGVPPTDRITADSMGVAPITPWVLAARDDVSPEVDRIRAVSTQDLEIRFSESLDVDLNAYDRILNEGESPVVRDSTGFPVSGDLSVYFTESIARSVFVRTPSLVPGSYTIENTWLLRDSSYNFVDSSIDTFVVSPGLQEPVAPEFLSWIPDSTTTSASLLKTIWPGETFGFRTTLPVQELKDAVIRDTSGTVYPAEFDHPFPTMFVLKREGSFEFDEPFFLEFNQRGFGGSDSLITGYFQFANERDTGELAFHIQSLQKDGQEPDHFFTTDVLRDNRLIKRHQSGESDMLITQLPGGLQPKLRVYQSASSSPFWGAGALFPKWIPADPIGWIEVIEPVRARWETVLPDTIDFQSWPMIAPLSDSTDTQ